MEIEVKARLIDKDAVIEKLLESGHALSEPLTQDDTVYVRNIGDLQTFLSNDAFARIRIENNSKIFVTVKKPAQKEQTSEGWVRHELVKHEYEFAVDSIEQAKGALELLGLHPAVRTVKKRRKAHYREYEICIDEVEGLGAFIEVEVIGEQETAEKVQAKMREFLMSLGVKSEDQVKKGYDILMLEKQLGN